jgi:CDP-paratose 2-epimerase
MKIVIVTGSCGLVGSESVSFFLKKGFHVVGLDNNFRKLFFGKDGDISWIKNKLLKEKNYTHYFTDIKKYNSLKKIF